MEEQAPQTSTGNENKKGKGSILYVIGIVLCIVVIGMNGLLMQAGLIILLLSRGESGHQPGGGGSGTGCYLNDDAFRDTATINDAKYVLDRLGAKYPALKEAEGSRKRVSHIITESKKAKVNPAIIVAIWGGEQSFGNEDKALGYDCPSGGCNPRSRGFEKQVAGALKVINDAIENRGYYTQPTGENIFTRLFYNYCGAMKTVYNSKGYVADESNFRVEVLNLLIPEDVTCESGAGGGGKDLNAIFGNARPPDCKGVEGSLVSINFMGKNVKVHSKAKADFEAVAADIKSAGVNYNFWRDSSGGTFVCRYNVNSKSEVSTHAYGIAIDINPDKNPNYGKEGVCKHDIPEKAIQAFKKHGFLWGGDFNSVCDGMHFEWSKY